MFRFSMHWPVAFDVPNTEAIPPARPEDKDGNVGLYACQGNYLMLF